MKEIVYFLKLSPSDNDKTINERLMDFIIEKDLFGFIQTREFVAIKTHFGEGEKMGFVRPPFFKILGKLVRDKGALPFFTETSTLYKGNRGNAVEHIEHANKHGFGYENTELPIIMSDGLYGDEETEVEIPGKIYKKVNISSTVVKSQAIIAVAHFTGHLATGFGAVIKTLGMGCASRKGKMIQHSTSKPKINSRKCTKCGECIEWCPVEAISSGEKSAVIDKEKCIGCGQCLTVCRFESVIYNWRATHETLQKKMTEHAWGAVIGKEKKTIFFNFLTKISKDCDCMTSYENITDDIGVLISYDPVAIDAASIDLVEEYSGKKLSQLAYDIPYMYQIDYAREIGFGNADYELVEI